MHLYIWNNLLSDLSFVNSLPKIKVIKITEYRFVWNNTPVLILHDCPSFTADNMQMTIGRGAASEGLPHWSILTISHGTAEYRYTGEVSNIIEEWLPLRRRSFQIIFVAWRQEGDKSFPYIRSTQCTDITFASPGPKKWHECYISLAFSYKISALVPLRRI